MIEPASVRLYTISKCGYYRWAESNPAFGNIPGLLDDLQRWVGTETRVQDTKTYERNEDGSLLPTYCYDISKCEIHGDVLLTTWNETFSRNNSVASVSGAEPVGTATVHTTEFPDGDIPGYATYFWFMAGTNYFATIQFENSMNGHRNLAHYFKGFLAWFSPHVVTIDNGPKSTNVELAGYSRGPGDEPMNVRPKYESKPIRKQGEIQYLRENAARIRKIVRKTRLTSAARKEMLIYRRALKMLGMMRQNEQSVDSKLRLSIDCTPSQDEFDAILTEWDPNMQGSQWNDVGFCLEGQGNTIRWMGSTLASDTCELDVTRQNVEIVDAVSILRAMAPERERMLRLAQQTMDNNEEATQE